MNFGYDSLGFREQPIHLKPEHEADRHCIQLYQHLLSSLPIAGRTVLDIGCGRGGGAAYIAQYLRPRKIVGIDICRKTVRICVSNHHDQKIAFLTSDAQLLPFRDASFDIVMNVESSHAYASMPVFLEDVQRILKPGGFFVFADLRWNSPSREARPSRGLTLLQQQLVNCGLVVVHESDLSSGVLQARTADNEGQRTSIRRLVPFGFRFVFSELAGLPGTTMYRRLEERNLVYWSSILQKPLRAN